MFKINAPDATLGYSLHWFGCGLLCPITDICASIWGSLHAPSKTATRRYNLQTQFVCNINISISFYKCSCEAPALAKKENLVRWSLWLRSTTTMMFPTVIKQKIHMLLLHWMVIRQKNNYILINPIYILCWPRKKWNIVSAITDKPTLSFTLKLIRSSIPLRQSNNLLATVSLLPSALMQHHSVAWVGPKLNASNVWHKCLVYNINSLNNTRQYLHLITSLEHPSEVNGPCLSSSCTKSCFD